MKEACRSFSAMREDQAKQQALRKGMWSVLLTGQDITESSVSEVASMIRDSDAENVILTVHRGNADRACYHYSPYYRCGTAICFS